MTDEKQSKENGNEKDAPEEPDSHPVRVLLFVTLAVIVLTLILFSALLSEVPRGAEGRMSCDPINEVDLFDKHIKKEWLMSDNITSYEDIPEEERVNLSENAREFLRRSGWGYKVISYQTLSNGEKKLFKSGVDSPVEIDWGNETHSKFREYMGKDIHIRYQREIYNCQYWRTGDG